MTSAITPTWHLGIINHIKWSGPASDSQLMGAISGVSVCTLTTWPWACLHGKAVGD